MDTLEQQLDTLRARAAEVIPADGLREKLALGRRLRVKLGLDPTAEHVTLGWAVVLRKLRTFQDLGHTAVLIVGDFTARIGDPSEQNKTRPMLSKEQVDAHVERVLGQFQLVLSGERLEIRRNSEWLEGLGTEGLLKLGSLQTVAQTLQRDDFAKRFDAGAPITVREFLYPLLQGYDSVAVSADVEIGGTDQTFNLLVGRDVQRAYGQPPQAVLTMPLLEGTDGEKKMSQSLGNYIALTEEPDDMFGKLMRVPDALMRKYFELCTDLDDESIAGIVDGAVRPEVAKRRLAATVVELYHGQADAAATAERFDRLFVEHRMPEDVDLHPIPDDCVDGEGVFLPKLLKSIGLAPSTTEARRLIAQGGVKVDGQTVATEHVATDEVRGHVIQVGKRHFARLR